MNTDYMVEYLENRVLNEVFKKVNDIVSFERSEFLSHKNVNNLVNVEKFLNLGKLNVSLDNDNLVISFVDKGFLIQDSSTPKVPYSVLLPRIKDNIFLSSYTAKLGTEFVEGSIDNLVDSFMENNTEIKDFIKKFFEHIYNQIMNVVDVLFNDTGFEISQLNGDFVISDVFIYAGNDEGFKKTLFYFTVGNSDSCPSFYNDVDNFPLSIINYAMESNVLNTYMAKLKTFAPLIKLSTNMYIPCNNFVYDIDTSEFNVEIAVSNISEDSLTNGDDIRLIEQLEYITKFAENVAVFDKLYSTHSFTDNKVVIPLDNVVARLANYDDSTETTFEQVTEDLESLYGILASDNPKRILTALENFTNKYPNGCGFYYERNGKPFYPICVLKAVSNNVNSLGDVYVNDRFRKHGRRKEHFYIGIVGRVSRKTFRKELIAKIKYLKTS